MRIARWRHKRPEDGFGSPHADLSAENIIARVMHLQMLLARYGEYPRLNAFAHGAPKTGDCEAEDRSED